MLLPSIAAGYTLDIGWHGALLSSFLGPLLISPDDCGSCEVNRERTSRIHLKNIL